jgi:hypothetical protein
MESETDFVEATAGGIERACDLAFAELMLLVVIGTLGATAICLAFWPMLLVVFVAEAVLAVAMVLAARRIIRGVSSRMDGIARGLREFCEDDAARIDGDAGTIEDSFNMWMDEVARSHEVRSDMESMRDEAQRIVLMSDAMLNGIVPKDADMILAMRSAAEHIQAVADSRVR